MNIHILKFLGKFTNKISTFFETSGNKLFINNDDDYSFDDICNRYVNETKQNKELIDLTFISICGYSLETLLFNKDKSFMFD